MRPTLAFGRPVSFASWAPSDFYINGARRQAPYVCPTPEARYSHHFAPCFDRDVISHTAAHRAQAAATVAAYTECLVARALRTYIHSPPAQFMAAESTPHTHALWIFAATLFSTPRGRGAEAPQFVVI